MIIPVHGLEATDIMNDIYFNPEFIQLYGAPDPIDTLETPQYKHGAAIRSIPGTDRTDMETPHGYGGPIARNISDLKDGIHAWRERQERAGHVAEFIRLHPFFDAGALDGLFDHLMVNRETVIVDMSVSREQHRAAYSKGTRHALRVAEQRLTVRDLAPNEGDILRRLHEDMLARNKAPKEAYFQVDSYRRLVVAPWSTTFLAEGDNGPVAAACFLSSGMGLCHYHLAGGNEEARQTKANYLLLETAFEHFSAQGALWMHLGGGRTAAVDDPLFRFKTKFSPLRVRFYTAGLIFDRDTYGRLGGGDGGSRFLGYRHSAPSGVGTPSP
jgi:hypothetical protein